MASTILLFPFCLVLVLASCSLSKLHTHVKASDLLISDGFSDSTPASITPDQTRIDLDYLGFGMRDGWVGYRLLQAIDRDRFESALSALSSSTIESPSPFCDAIGDLLWDLPDAHLEAKLGNHRCGNKFRSNARHGNVGKNIAFTKKQTGPHGRCGRPLRAISKFRF
jgi:hypothetical protein